MRDPGAGIGSKAAMAENAARAAYSAVSITVIFFPAIMIWAIWADFRSRRGDSDIVSRDLTVPLLGTTAGSFSVNSSAGSGRDRAVTDDGSQALPVTLAEAAQTALAEHALTGHAVLHRPSPSSSMPILQPLGHNTEFKVRNAPGYRPSV